MSKIIIPHLITFPEKKNSKPGILVPIEDYDVDMVIKRIFYIYGFAQDADKIHLSRGTHGHYKAKQVIICISGSCEVVVSNTEGHYHRYLLTSPSTGIVLPKGNMVEMSNYSKNAILLVLCDKNYKDDEIFSK
jgi:hypothetical protein